MQTDYYISGNKEETRTGIAADRLAFIEQLMTASVEHVPPARQDLGRNSFTRAIDLAFDFARKYVPPVHWLGASMSAVILYFYVRLVAFTARLRTSGKRAWPDVSAGSVLTLWHRDAPSLIVAFAMCRPTARCSIMISGDWRGDCLALLCRMLGFHVVRGGSEEGGWQALVQLAEDLAEGASVIITADGGGPARVAKVGAVALASAAAVPLLPLTANCYPAIEQRHKWDTARNPLPFGSVLVSLGPACTFEPFVDAVSIERARKSLEDVLNRMSLELR